MRHSGGKNSAEPTSGTRIGYTRVSTVAQTLDQQNEALTAAGVTKTFSDTMSGARDDRPGLADLLDYVRSNDRNLWMSLGSWRESGRTSPRMIITGIRYSIKTGVGALVGKVRPCSR